MVKVEGEREKFCKKKKKKEGDSRKKAIRKWSAGIIQDDTLQMFLGYYLQRQCFIQKEGGRVAWDIAPPPPPFSQSPGFLPQEFRNLCLAIHPDNFQSKIASESI